MEKENRHSYQLSQPTGGFTRWGLVVRILTQAIHTIGTPRPMKDLSSGLISQALIACMPSSSVGREVDLLLARLNDRSAAIVVEVSDDGGQIVVVTLQLTYLLEMILRFFLQPDFFFFQAEDGIRDSET